ncbi:recombinase, RecT family [Klebsiella pneumoniae]|nr:recombinase, RecT family [Klebsiella pneumoniae]
MLQRRQVRGFHAKQCRQCSVVLLAVIDARNKVEAAINSLPNPGEPEAVELFAKAEGILNGAKRHLGDELYDQFRIALDDMKPEYVG